MALLLNVPYKDKENAKSLGAKWNKELKKWYIEDRNQYLKLREWFNNKDAEFIIFNKLYLATSDRECFKCKNINKVVALAIRDYVIFDESDEDDDYDYDYEIIDDGDINFISYIESIPLKLATYLKNKYCFYRDYSKFIQSYYFANHCRKCGVIQGDNYLQFEPSEPFFICSEECAEKITLYEIKLKNDLDSIMGGISYSSHNFLLDEYATFCELNLDI